METITLGTDKTLGLQYGASLFPYKMSFELFGSVSPSRETTPRSGKNEVSHLRKAMRDKSC